jgi:hypothetical protein
MNENEPNTKPWYESRILWFNVISVLLAFLELKTQAIKPLLSAAAYEWLLLLIPLGNMLLRMNTSTALTFRPEPPAATTATKEGPKP